MMIERTSATGGRATDADARLNDYLRELERLLAAAPDSTRASVVDDVRAHLADALDAGRTVDEALAALGPVEEVAEQFRRELGIAADRDAVADASAAEAAELLRLEQRAGRASALLGWVSVGLALLTAVAIALLSPVDDGGGLSDGSIAGTAVITGAAVVLALLPLLLPRRTLLPAAVTATVAMTVLAVFAGDDRGLMLVPLVVMMWAAAVVPWRVRHGLDISASPLWRIFAGVLVSLPALVVVAGVMSGSVGIAWQAAAGAALFLLLGVLYACGVRLAYYGTAVIGAVLLGAGLAWPGMLFLAVWWAGGMLLAVGATGISASAQRVRSA